MATTHTNLTVGKTYAVTSASGCTVTLANGVQLALEAGQDYFTPDTPDVVISDDDATLVLLFNHAPGRRGSGGNIESDLNVGHGAADAVAAVCTLTLGDLGTGGTLADSNGQSVELDAPQAYAVGSVDIADATEAGSITFGTHETIALPAKAAAYATGMLIYDPNSGSGFLVGGESVSIPETLDSAEAWSAGLAGTGTECTAVEAVSESRYEVAIRAVEAGEAGNAITLAADAGNEVSGPALTGGEEARTPQDVVDILNESEDCPAVATLDADEGGIAFTAKEYGVNDTIVVTGSLFSDEMGMSGGHGDYTVAELVTAISGEFSDITPAAGETEGTITLTATTAGKAANTITYTATGCLGSGITRQGSTTRGKDAVEQTAFKIYLNGEEFTGGSITVDPAPTQGSENAVSSGGVYTALRALPAPVPEPLGTTTTLLHGHVYTLAVAADTDLSALGVELNASAELWIDYTAGSVTWPALWSWVDGIVPIFTAGTRYFVRVWSDGVAVIAKLEYSYANA